MVELRRRMLMPKKQILPLYQLEQGRFQRSDYNSIEVTGNHVKINGLISNWFFGLTPLGIGVTYINNQPVWLTVPSGSECILKFSNIVCITQGSINKIALNFREANKSTSLDFGTGNFNCKNVSEKIITKKTTRENRIGSLFLYSLNTDTDAILDFDVEFYVDGVRWI